jgi:hypothetical protein
LRIYLQNKKKLQKKKKKMNQNLYLPISPPQPPPQPPPPPAPYNHNNIKQYDYFKPPSNVSTSSYFAVSSYQQGPKGECPNCLQGISFFNLPNENSNTIFCYSCKQPSHKCPIHKVTIQGMGISFDDPKSKQCQCNIGQSFLGDNRWDSCFN